MSDKEKGKESKNDPKKEDSLFLIEALVDKIVFPPNPEFPELPEKDFRTCVTIECKNIEPIEICDDEPGGVEHKSGGGLIKVFNCGKSCLFFLNDGDIKASMSKFTVKITVFKALPCGCLPAKLIIGEAVIDLTKEFVEARNTFLKDPTCVSSQALKDTFLINDVDGKMKAEIVMFLRISCFGKLIVTRFQGGAPNLKIGHKSSESTCHTKSKSSVSQLPCTAGHGHGVCPPARDPYGRMICEDPEDPCYCSGPHQPPREPVACRNTDPYCLHIPKDPSLPYLEELTEEQKENLRKSITEDRDYDLDLFKNKNPNTLSDISCKNSWKKSPFGFGCHQTLVYMVSVVDKKITRRASGSQATALMNKCMQVHFSENQTPLTTTDTDSSNVQVTPKSRMLNSLFQNNQLLNPTVYYWGKKSRVVKESKAIETDHSSRSRMFLGYKPNVIKRRSINISEDDSYRRHRSGKSEDDDDDDAKSPRKSSKSSSKGSTKSSSDSKSPKSDSSKSSSSKSKSSKSSSKSSSSKSGGSKSSEGTQSQVSSIRSVASGSAPPPPCINKAGMSVTVKHILIGPVEPCPISGNKPCTGPACVKAAEAATKSPVSISNVNNPRRGVFELVIRKINGAPLARNELMLEWTLPQPNPPPCAAPCPPLPCAIPCYKPYPKPCRSRGKYLCSPSKCLLPRRSCCALPCRKPCCSPCQRPCGLPCRKKCCFPCKRPCGLPSCATCRSCCKTPCAPCPPVRCCPPLPCDRPSCCSNPCLRVCPVGRRKSARRCCSYPRIRPHKVHCSPCKNRSRSCPVVRCRSLPCLLPKLCSPYRPPYCPPFACNPCISCCRIRC